MKEFCSDVGKVGVRLNPTKTGKKGRLPVKQFSSDVGEVGAPEESKRFENPNSACELGDHCGQQSEGEP